MGKHVNQVFGVWGFSTHYWILNLSKLFKKPSFKLLPRRTNVNKEFIFPKKKSYTFSELLISYYFLIISIFPFSPSLSGLTSLTSGVVNFYAVSIQQLFSFLLVSFYEWKLLNEIHIWLNALISQKACFPDLCIHRSECQSVTSLCISKVLFFSDKELFWWIDRVT